MTQPTADYPPLAGWLTAPQVADRLGVTKQAVHKMIAQQVFSEVRTVGSGASKVTYVIAEREVDRVASQRSADQARRQAVTERSIAST